MQHFGPRETTTDNFSSQNPPNPICPEPTNVHLPSVQTEQTQSQTPRPIGGRVKQGRKNREKKPYFPPQIETPKPLVKPHSYFPFQPSTNDEKIKHKRLAEISKRAQKNSLLKEALMGHNFEGENYLDLLIHPKFDNPLRKFGSPKEVRSIQQIVNQIGIYEPSLIHFLNSMYLFTT